LAAVSDSVTVREISAVKPGVRSVIFISLLGALRLYLMDVGGKLSRRSKVESRRAVNGEWDMVNGEWDADASRRGGTRMDAEEMKEERRGVDFGSPAWKEPKTLPRGVHAEKRGSNRFSLLKRVLEPRFE
jgi:hypothetical protein